VNGEASRTAAIRALVASGDYAAAEVRLAGLLRALFRLEPLGVEVNRDQYSLNSLNGFFEAAGQAYFFKFHQEEGEEAMTGEYYRVGLLADAGMPVDRPVFMSTDAGNQVLVYRRRSSPRFADVLRELDGHDDPGERRRVIAAQRTLARTVSGVYRKTLHEISATQAAAEPLQRLFWERIVDPRDGAYPGGRLASYYVDRVFEFPGATLPWASFSRLRFVVNGIEYADTVGALFDSAHERLAPRRLAGGGLVAHGDAHNANAWYDREGDGARLEYYDPAFAGAHVPALLAEVKPTFHNVFAHPLWLYEPSLQPFTAACTVDGDVLRVTHDWRMAPLRRELLEVQAEEIWRPLLADLAARGLLAPDWRRVLRLALFLCPTLVLDLRAGAALHTPISSLLGFSVAVMCGSEPVAGGDEMTAFLETIAPR